MQHALHAGLIFISNDSLAIHNRLIYLYFKDCQFMIFYHFKRFLLIKVNKITTFKLIRIKLDKNVKKFNLD